MEREQSFDVSEKDLQVLLSGQYNKIKSAAAKKLGSSKAVLTTGQLSLAIKPTDGLLLYLEFQDGSRNPTKEVMVYLRFKPQITGANYHLVGE